MHTRSRTHILIISHKINLSHIFSSLLRNYGHAQSLSDRLTKTCRHWRLVDQQKLYAWRLIKSTIKIHHVFLYKNLFFDDTIHIMYKMISSIQAIFKLYQSVQSLILMLVHVPWQLVQVWHAKHWLINVSYISHNIKYILYYLWFTAVEEIKYLDLHKSLGVCNIRMDIIKYVGIYSNISCSIQ